MEILAVNGLLRGKFMSNRILWRQVWALSALLAAILLSFTVYGVYQPKILTQLGLGQLAAWFSIFQGFLGLIVEPCFGYLSDRCLRRLGSRLPQITIGITLAGLIFVMVAIINRENLLFPMARLIPVLMIFWLTAMIAVRGPIVVLLQQFAPQQDLIDANGVLVLVLGLTGAISPILENWLQKVGISLSFVFGAIVLLIGAIIFYSQTLPHSLSLLNVSTPRQPLGKKIALEICLTGIGIGLTLALLRALLNQSLTLPLPNGGILSIVLTIAAVFAYPLRKITHRLRAKRGLQLGLVILAIFSLVALIAQNLLLGIIVLIAVGIALGLIFESMIPFVMSLASPTMTGLAMGLYFGGYGFSSALFDLFNQIWGKLTSINLEMGIILIVILILTGLQRINIKARQA
jgi:MFS family permease